MRKLILIPAAGLALLIGTITYNVTSDPGCGLDPAAACALAAQIDPPKSDLKVVNNHGAALTTNPQTTLDGLYLQSGSKLIEAPAAQR